MTRGAWMCRQQDDGLKIWCAPRENEKPFTDSERAQKWRLSLASLLFLTVLLSDHLWFCAEAKLTRTRDKRLDKLAFTDMDDYQTANHILSSSPHPPHSSPRKKGNATFIGNYTERVWRLETCHPDSLSEDCFTFDDAETVCKGISEMAGRQTAELILRDFYLSFCNSYSLLDLFYGLSSPENLNCSLDVFKDGNHLGCSRCVQAYQQYDQYAQERYEDFESMIQKYETDAYSVRTCMEECKAVYKPWMCSQLLHTTQRQCSNKIPCKQYCLEVQQRCPFILPHDDLIQGGSPSFICTAGLSEQHAADLETQCCDVRWSLTPDGQRSGMGALKWTHPSCLHRTSVSASAASRLCSGSGRLKLCVLVLVLLHTVVILSTAQNSTGLDLGPLSPMEEASPNEE